jgi:hypothetical protein
MLSAEGHESLAPHQYIQHYAEKMKEIRKQGALQAAAVVREARSGDESEDCM